MDKGGRFRFRLEIGGVPRAAFLEVTGLGAEVEVAEFREGDHDVSPELPAAPPGGTVAFKRGIALNSALQDWYNTWVNDESTAERQDAVVVLVDEEGTDAERWQLSSVRPVTWIASGLEDEADITAIETLELLHEGAEIQS